MVDENLQKNRVFQVKVPLEKGREFEEVCEREDKTVNAKLRELIEEATKGQKKYFTSGEIVMEYDRKRDQFVWKVILEDGREILIFDNIGLDFVRDMKINCENAIQDRNDWIHGKGGTSIPKKLLEDGK